MNALKDLLRRHHARMKRAALFLLRRAIIPALLSMIYVFGIGFTKLLLMVGGNPLYGKKTDSGGSFWVSDETGAPDEEKYLRQS